VSGAIGHKEWPRSATGCNEAGDRSHTEQSNTKFGMKMKQARLILSICLLIAVAAISKAGDNKASLSAV